MKYLVMEIHPAYAVVLDEEGRFLKAANLHYQVGDTVQNIVELQMPKAKPLPIWKPLSGLAAAAACFCLVFFGYYQPNFTAYGTLRIQTGASKPVSHQLKENPKGEICAFDAESGTWLRVAATFVEDPRIEAQEHMLDAHPNLRKNYAPGDGNTIIYYLKDAEATFSSFTAPSRTVKF